MKRNETVLVYAVTGLLLFILVVAVVFGDDPTPAKAGEMAGRNPPAAEQPGEDPLSGLFPKPGEEPAKTGEDDKSGDVEKPDDKSDIDENPPKSALKIDAPKPSVPVLTPDMRLAQALGTSTKEGDYRKISARRGQSLAELVEVWCGSKDRLPEVEAINEALVGKRLAGGEPVLVPWVDADVLLEAKKERDARLAELEKQRGKPYVIQKGDSAWKLAARFVPSNKIPAWLREFKERNPQLVSIDSLREGQKVRLPN